MSDYTMPVLSEQEREIDIAACIEALQVMEKNLKTWGCVWKGYIESQIRRQRIALAALTAEPVAIEAEVNGVMRSVSNTAERISLMSYEKR